MLILVILGVFVLVVLFLRFPQLAIAFFHPLLDLFYGFKDLYLFFRYCRWRECSSGELLCYSGLFGKGKTLSAVHTLRQNFKKYNNKKIYDFTRKKWVTQKIRILSNVTFNDIPFTPLNSLAEIVSEANFNKNLDFENDTYTVIFALIDEASVQLNSREFKKNISADFLNTLLTCRHFHLSIFYTSQRFNLTDKLLRDVTQRVVDCRKIWRLQGHFIFDAWELENSARPDEVKPIRVGGFFARDCDFNSYDTLATVDKLEKATSAGDMLSEEEVISRRVGNNNIYVDARPKIGLFGKKTR